MTVGDYAAKGASTLLKWLSKLFWNRRIDAVRDELRDRLSDRISQTQIGALTLECLTSPKPRTSTVVARAADGTEERHTVTSTSTQWDGETEFVLWDNRSLQLYLIADADKPSPAQIRHIESLLDYRKSIRQPVLAALLNYYREQVLPHNPTNEDGDSLPAITKVSELPRVFVSDDPSIHIEGTDTGTFSLGFGVWWGYHDVQVHIRNWSVESVG